jgi:Tol biopolymer transport system component
MARTAHRRKGLDELTGCAYRARPGDQPFARIASACRGESIHILSLQARAMLNKRMYRLLILAVALAFLGVASVGGARNAEFNFDIVAVDLAGRETNLTRNAAFDGSPAVARDGRIAFVSTRGGTPDLYVMNGNGRNVRRLTDSATDGSGVAWDDALHLTQASWSPRGDKIGFDGRYMERGPGCMRLCANWRVLVVESNGGQPTEIARNARAPAWSPDGRQLAFESGMDPEELARTLTIARADGSRPAGIEAINFPSDVGPVWSPAGGEIAFPARRTEGSQTWVYLVRADARRKRRLAAGNNPTWSPDGRRLAFIDKSDRLITMTGNSKRTRRVSRAGEAVIAAAWAPKGDTLAFLAGPPNPYGGFPRHLRLETVRANGKQLRVLTHDSGSSHLWGRPVWTPSAKRILITVGSH